MIVGLVQRINVQQQAPTLTADRLIVGKLDAANPTLVYVDEAKKVRRDRAADVKPLHLVYKTKSLQTELFHLRNFLVIELTFDCDGRMAGRKPFVQIIAIDIEQIRKRICHAAGVGYIAR